MTQSHTRTMFFAVIISIILVSFGFISVTPAHAENSTATTTQSQLKNKKASKNVDASCMQSAVATRESSLLTAFTTFHEDIEEALTTRLEALDTAWGLSTGKERTKALASAWKTWKTDHKEITDEFKSSRKSAWDTFKSTVKSTCKETLPKDEALSKDSAGSLSI